MPFPTVRSDPWKKGTRRRRRRFQLWPGEFWKRLARQSLDDLGLPDPVCSRFRRRPDLSPACVAMITAMNAELYGN